VHEHCNLCGSQDIRLSHFRPSDVVQLFSLRYPVRCRNCGERNHYSVWDALRIRKGQRKHPRAQPAANVPADSDTPPSR